MERNLTESVMTTPNTALVMENNASPDVNMHANGNSNIGDVNVTVIPRGKRKQQDGAPGKDNNKKFSC